MICGLRGLALQDCGAKIEDLPNGVKLPVTASAALKFLQESNHAQVSASDDGGRGWMDCLWYRTKGPKLLKPERRHEI
jgi:hypothetical protein